jgi:hypothetical protein
VSRDLLNGIGQPIPCHRPELIAAFASDKDSLACFQSLM